MPSHPNRLQRVPGPPRGDHPKSLYSKQTSQRHPVKLAPDAVMDVTELERELLARSFRDFIPRAFPYIEPAERYVHGWHVDATAEHMQACVEGQIDRLVINIPPGHMKSIIASVAFPAWVWARQAAPYLTNDLNGQHTRFLYTSYSDDFVARDSAKTTNLINSEWYQERWPCNLTKANTTELHNDKGGFRLGAGVMGGVTGKHVHYALADDPIKAQEAHSKAAREQAIRFWQETLTTRMLPGGVRIIVMQRLHQKDLTGFVLEESGYVHLMLPEAYEPKRSCVTVLGKVDKREEEGELLWPERFPSKEHKRRAKELGPFGFAGQLQQRPAPAEGGILKRAWWKRYAKNERFADGFVIDSWDMTFDDESDGGKHDFVVGTKFVCRGSQMQAIRQYRQKAAFDEVLPHVESMAKDAQYPANVVLVEKAANGPAIVRMLRKKVQALTLVSSSRSKIERAHAAAPRIHSGDVMLPEGEDWVDNPTDGLIVEAGDFPNADHDDQVDSVTQAVLWHTEEGMADSGEMDLSGGERESPSRVY